jgi:hypothetical protein
MYCIYMYMYIFICIYIYLYVYIYMYSIYMAWKIYQFFVPPGSAYEVSNIYIYICIYIYIYIYIYRYTYAEVRTALACQRLLNQDVNKSLLYMYMYPCIYAFLLIRIYVHACIVKIFYNIQVYS